MTRTWYRIALGRTEGAPIVVAAAGEHMGVAVAAAERHARGAFAIAAEPAPDSDIPLGESLGKSMVVELGAAPPVPVFRWPVGALPQLSRAAELGEVRRGWLVRPHASLLVIEAQTDAEHLTDLFMGMIERLPSADNLEIRMQEHFDDAGRADVWLTSRVDAKRILRFLDDHDAELFGNGHLELSIYVRAQKATLRLTEHKTVVWLSDRRAVDGTARPFGLADGRGQAPAVDGTDVQGWLRELAVPRVDSLITVKDGPHYHYRPANSRDRKKLGDELYRQRLRRVDSRASS